MVKPNISYNAQKNCARILDYIPQTTKKVIKPVGKHVEGDKKMGFEINFEGKSAVKPFVEPDSYVGTILNVSDLFTSKNPFTGEDDSQFSVNIELDGITNEDGKSIRVPYFIKAKIVHSAKKAGYADSKLYSFLEKAGKLEDCKTFCQANQGENFDKLLIEWMKTAFLGEQLKFICQTVIPKDGGDKYSKISEVIKFIGVKKDLSLSQEQQGDEGQRPEEEKVE